jgi:hypothetical protein
VAWANTKVGNSKIPALAAITRTTRGIANLLETLAAPRGFSGYFDGKWTFGVFRYAKATTRVGFKGEGTVLWTT